MADSQKPEQSTDENQTFAEAMQGTTPLKSSAKRQRENQPLRKKKAFAYHRDMASKEEDRIIDGLSSEAVEIVESEEELLFAAPGVQINLLKRLRKGHIPWEAGLDLHGMTVDTARDELSRFIRDAYYQSQRVVIVVHGKSFTQSGQQPILKSYVNDWLRQLPQVLAFASAQPKDGGTGALYVLLRQSKP